MSVISTYCHDIGVALLAEGVDRNSVFSTAHTSQGKSPSSRRAWIEIPAIEDGTYAARVALLAEGVDRNLYSI